MWKSLCIIANPITWIVIGLLVVQFIEPHKPREQTCGEARYDLRMVQENVRRDLEIDVWAMQTARETAQNELKERQTFEMDLHKKYGKNSDRLAEIAGESVLLELDLSFEERKLRERAKNFWKRLANATSEVERICGASKGQSKT